MATSVSERVEKHRAALRQAGLRPVQIWVPDTRRPSFVKECKRQARVLKKDAHETEVLAWIEQASDDQGWKP